MTKDIMMKTPDSEFLVSSITVGSWITCIASAKVWIRLCVARQDGSKRKLVLKKETEWKIADERGRDKWIQAHGTDTPIWC